MKAVSLKIYHFSKWTLLVFLILVALLSIAGRTLLNNVAYFKNSIEQELADYGIKGVALENVEGHWQGLQPFLKISGASLSIPGRSHALSVNELSLKVKLVPSLLSGDLILESFHSNIEKLVLVRDIKGAWWLNDIPLSAGAGAKTKLDIFAFFQRLPSFVNIDIGLIQLRDLRHGKDYLIQGSTLSSSRKKQQLFVKLFTRLPESLGKKVELSLTGDALKQKLFVKAEELEMAAVFDLVSVQDIPIVKAVISLESWVNLESFHINDIISKAKVSQLNINREKDNFQSLGFSFEQKATASPQQWKIDTEIKKIHKGSQKFADLNSQLLISKQGEKPKLWLDRVSLSFLHSILQDLVKDESVAKLLAAIQPAATLENIVAELDLMEPKASIFGFDFTDYHSRYYESIPELSGIDGSLLYAKGVAQLNIEAKDVLLNFGDFFRAPIKLNTLRAKSLLSIKNSTLYVQTDNFSASNDDVSLQGRVELEAPPKGRPFISIRANYENGTVKAIPRYLPVKIMHDNVINWIDKSLLSGHISEGDFLYHGRLVRPSLFAKKRSGIMHASFKAKDIEVDYLADWPIARQGEGEFDFVNTSMNVDVSKVKYAQTTADKVNINIPDFLISNLWLNASIETDAKTALATLSSLPILNLFDEVKQKTRVISGPIKAKIKLDIPLSGKLKKDIRVTAKASLKGVALSIPEWMINFKALKGVVDIDNEKVSSSNLSGLFYGDKVKLSVKPENATKRTLFNLSGNIHSANLLNLAPAYLQKPVSGVSPWTVSVSVAHQPTNKLPLLVIVADSNLRGTQLDYPEPARLSEKEKKTIKIKAKLFENLDFPFDLSLGENFNVSGYLNFAEQTTDNLLWMNVYFGAENMLTEKSGVTIAGQAEQIDLNDWFEYQKVYFADEDDGSSPFLQQVNSLELNIQRLIMADQQALDSHIKIVNDGKQLTGTIDSSLVEGRFELPYKMSILRPFMADLEFIKLKKSTSTEKTKIDINDMPNLFIKSKAVSFEKMDFNDFILSTRNESNNFIVEQLDLSRDRVNLKSSGHWQYEPQSQEHVSVFNIDIKGSDFGKTIDNLGLGETIKGSTVDFNGQIGWGGELYSINWPTLIGEVDLKLEDGYLQNVEPGAGRFVGLLSFNALPKRLFLGFGDVFKEGMQFSEINGKFSIQGEMMTSENTSLDSVSAKVKVKGQTNLRHQTYDQSMTIIPKIGDTLPLLGTLAAGSTVGWGLLLLQKIFNKPIEKSVEIEYKVTGSWENPEVNLINKAKIKQESESFNVEDL